VSGLERMDPIKVTKSAARRARELIDLADKPVLGIRIGIDSTGCSGFSYKVEYAEDEKKFEDVVVVDGINFYVDPKAVMYLLGSELDYRETTLEKGFVFNNPNETSRCGCGESFSVSKE